MNISNEAHPHGKNRKQIRLFSDSDSDSDSDSNSDSSTRLAQ